MSTLSISPFSSSPLHGFRLSKSSSGRSSQAGCGDSDWPSLFPFASDSSSHHHLSDPLPTSDSFPHVGSFAGFPSSTSFSALTTTSPTFLSPLEPHTSSPALVSPKFFSPLDTLSPPRHFASSTTTITSSSTSTTISSASHGVVAVATSPLFTSSPLTVSPSTAASSSLTSSLTARRHEDAKAASVSPTWASPTPATSSASPSHSAPALPVTEKRKATPASTPRHSPQRGASRSPHHSHQSTSPPSLASTVSSSSSSSPSSTYSFSSSSSSSSSSSFSSQPASALSDMSNYLTFEVLNIDPATGHMITEETPFSPANAAAIMSNSTSRVADPFDFRNFDFIAMHQPLQDALAPPPLSGPPADDYHSLHHHLDDPETLIRGRSPSPASAGDDEGEEEDDGMVTRFASPPASFFAPSPPQHFAPPLTESSSHVSAAFAPFPSSHSHSIPSPSHHHSSSHQPHHSKPLSPSSPPTLHPSAYPHHPSHHHFASQFKHSPGLPSTADGVVGGDLSFPEDELDPGMLNLIFSPVGDAGGEGVAMDEGVEGEEDQHYVEAEDLILHRSNTGGDRNRSMRKRHPRPVSPVTARRFSFPALRVQGAGGGGSTFAPLSPSLSVSSHNSSGSSPLPRSFASDEEGSVHSQGSHGPRMATVQASVMAHQVTPVTAMRVLPTPASVASAEQPMTALTVAQPGSASPSPTPAMAVKAASASAPTTPSSSAVVSALSFSGSAKNGGSKGAVLVGTVIAEAAVSASIPSAFTATALIPPSSVTATQMATASPASPTLASASPHIIGAVQATATGSATSSSLQRARVVGAGSLHPRQAFALPQSKKMKMKHTHAVHSSAPLFASRVGSALPSTVQTAAARPASVVHATPVQASAVQGRTWRTASK